MSHISMNGPKLDHTIYQGLQTAIDHNRSDYATRDGSKTGLDNGYTSVTGWEDVAANPGRVLTQNQLSELGDGNAKLGRSRAQQAATNVLIHWNEIQKTNPNQQQWNVPQGDPYIVPPGYNNQVFMSDQELDAFMSKHQYQFPND